MAIMKKTVSKRGPEKIRRSDDIPELMSSPEDIFSKPVGQLTLRDLYLVGVLNEKNKIVPNYAVSVALSDDDIAKLAAAIAEAIDA